MQTEAEVGRRSAGCLYSALLVVRRARRRRRRRKASLGSKASCCERKSKIDQAGWLAVKSEHGRKERRRRRRRRRRKEVRKGRRRPFLYLSWKAPKLSEVSTTRSDLPVVLALFGSREGPTSLFLAVTTL